MRVVNPATGEVVGEFETLEPEQVDEKLGAAHAAFADWRNRPFAVRAAVLKKAAAILRDQKKDLARLMAVEMGKPISEGRAEITKCASVCDYYAENGEKFLESISVSTDAKRSFVAFRPLGVVLAVMPGNFPFWQVFRFAAPGLMAGNVGVLKHASNVPGCAQRIEQIFRDAGAPSGVFTTLLVGSDAVSRIIADRRIAAVTLTGSTAAGRAVASTAGHHLKKTVLELGGSDPYVILEDADLAAAVSTCVTSRLINGGQSCIAAKRFIVPDKIRKDVEARFVERMSAFELGDPLEENTRLGPQARIELRDELHDQVRRSVDAGARLLLGGAVPERPGAWYPPTILTDVTPEAPAYHEELFGPVASILPAKDDEDALRIANDTTFGLGAAVFTRDLKRGGKIAEQRLDAGSCFVNSFVRSDPRLPFGGIKESGYGRELAEFGIREFVNVKTVYVA